MDSMDMMPIQPQSRYISKSEVKQALLMYLQSSGRLVNTMEEISDNPPVCKHACVVGVDVLYNLPLEVFQYEDITIPFYYCSMCGKLIVWLSF